MISVFRTKSFYLLLLFTLLCVATLTFLFSHYRNIAGLRVECNVDGAEVFLNGKKIGICPLSFTPKAGQYAITLKKAIDADTYYYYESTITIRDSEPQRVKAEMYRRFTDEANKKMDSNMVYVKGGCFKMGDVFGDNFCDSQFEQPVHEVCLDGFYIGKYEVTQAVWQKVMGKNPSRFVSDRFPVESISKADMLEFTSKLKAMTGRNYRLPTEAEWEYAARSGGKNERWAGTNKESELSEYAWFIKNSEGTTHFVGLKKPNGLGLYDMSGNVAEMVQDGWSRYQDIPQRNPQGPGWLENRHSGVVRGGSFFFGRSDQVRVFDRGGNSKSGGDFYIGFRLARSVE